MLEAMTGYWRLQWMPSVQFMPQCRPFFVSGFNTEDLASKALISGRNRGHVIAKFTTIGVCLIHDQL